MDHSRLVNPSPTTYYDPKGIVLLKESASDDYTYTGMQTGRLTIAQHHPYDLPPTPPGTLWPSDEQKVPQIQRKKRWSRTTKIATVVAAGALVLMAIFVPTGILISINSRASPGAGNVSPTPSTTRVTTPSRASTTTGPTSTVSILYPTTLANGSILIDPVIRPANAAVKFNLAPIQNSVAIFPDNGYEYHVVFGRSLSTAERTFPNPPYVFNTCANANVVVCILEVNLVALNPNTYGTGAIGSVSALSVTVNGTQGVQLSFGLCLMVSASSTFKSFV
ncbi:hypothetical protein BJ742DRAFT_284949 [Cladochytrium replicatum]|nr:hypothetical protein BJ742DRAFT_284949 [Cladochytrium replicatum]